MSNEIQPHNRLSLNAGQKISMGIALYMIVKPVFNFVALGGSLAPLAIGLAAMVCFYFGVKRSNTVIAILLMLTACAYFPQNVRNHSVIYLLEGAAGMVFAVVLAFNTAVRKHFKMTN